MIEELQNLFPRALEKYSSLYPDGGGLSFDSPDGVMGPLPPEHITPIWADTIVEEMMLIAENYTDLLLAAEAWPEEIQKAVARAFADDDEDA